MGEAGDDRLDDAVVGGWRSPRAVEATSTIVPNISSGGSTPTVKKSRGRTISAAPRQTTTKQRSKNRRRWPTSVISTAATVRVRALARATTSLPRVTPSQSGRSGIAWARGLDSGVGGDHSSSPSARRSRAAARTAQRWGRIVGVRRGGAPDGPRQARGVAVRAQRQTDARSRFAHGATVCSAASSSPAARRGSGCTDPTARTARLDLPGRLEDVVGRVELLEPPRRHQHPRLPRADRLVVGADGGVERAAELAEVGAHRARAARGGRARPGGSRAPGRPATRGASRGRPCAAGRSAWWGWPARRRGRRRTRSGSRRPRGRPTGTTRPAGTARRTRASRAASASSAWSPSSSTWPRSCRAWRARWASRWSGSSVDVASRKASSGHLGVDHDACARRPAGPRGRVAERRRRGGPARRSRSGRPARPARPPGAGGARPSGRGPGDAAARWRGSGSRGAGRRRCGACRAPAGGAGPARSPARARSRGAGR